MAMIETGKKTVELVEEYVEGIQELTNSVTVARQEDAGSSSLRTLPTHTLQALLPSPLSRSTHGKVPQADK
jgi:hypothetical protein